MGGVGRSMNAADATRARGTMSRRSKGIVDRLSVLLFASSWVAAFADVAPRLLADPLRITTLLAALPALVAGYLVADFLAGSVHWLADRFFDPATPILGPMLVAPFREHHVDSMSIGRHDFFEVSGNNALVSIPVVLALFALPPATAFGSVFLALFGLSLTSALVATNQFHGWAHAVDPPRLVRRLHRLGLILTPERHASHHTSAHDRAYCVTSGWLNPLLDRLHFFERLERAIEQSPPRRRRMT